MDELGINLKVDARAVKEAKRDLDFLNKSLRETEDFDISLGGDELSKDAEMLRRVSMELTRLGQLARTGDNSGGFLSAKQFEQVSKLSKEIGTNLGGWTAQTQKLRNELKQVTADLRQLQKDSLSPGLSPLARGMMLDEMEVLSGRKGELRKELSARSKYDARAGYMGRRAQEYADTISGFDMDGQNGESGSTALLGLGKKALGYGLALLGVGSVMGLLKSSWDKTQKQEILETGLLMRGVSYDRRVSPWNYSPQEETEGIMGMRKMTGAGDMETLTRLERFSRLNNMDLLSSMGIMGGFYQATGADPNKQRQALDSLLYMGKQAKDGRTEALLQLINANLLTAQHAQGGRALSDTQSSSVIAQTAALYNAPGTMGFSSGLFKTMQNALMPGGDPGSEMIKWDIIGGFNGPMTVSKLLELERRRNAGLNDPQNLKRALAAARRFSPTREGQIFYMMRLLTAFGQQGGIDQATAIIDNGDRLLNARMPAAGEITKSLDLYVGTYKGSAGYRIGQRDMESSVAALNTGGLVEGTVGPAKGAVARGWRGGSALVEAHKYDPLIQSAARKYGISPAWFLAMIMNESGGNPRAKSPKGALGLGQMLPSTFAQFGRKGGNILDPADNVDASAKYAAFLFQKYGIEGGTMAYNEGPGNYEKGLRPAETLQYLGKVKKYAGLVGTTGGLGGWDVGSNYPVAVLDPSLKNAWDTMVRLLEKISKNTEHLNVGAVSSGSLRPLPVGR